MPTGKVNGTLYYKTEDGEYIEVKEIKYIHTQEDIEQERANYEAWNVVEELLSQCGFVLLPSEETARKIAEMESE